MNNFSSNFMNFFLNFLSITYIYRWFSLIRLINKNIRFEFFIRFIFHSIAFISKHWFKSEFKRLTQIEHHPTFFFSKVHVFFFFIFQMNLFHHIETIEQHIESETFFYKRKIENVAQTQSTQKKFTILPSIKAVSVSIRIYHILITIAIIRMI